MFIFMLAWKSIQVLLGLFISEKDKFVYLHIVNIIWTNISVHQIRPPTPICVINFTLFEVDNTHTYKKVFYGKSSFPTSPQTIPQDLIDP